MTRKVEDELSKIDNLSEANVEAMVERTLKCQSDSEKIAAPVAQSMVSTCEQDFTKQKQSNASNFLSYDGRFL